MLFRSDPAQLKWGEVEAEYVVESTGLFLSADKAQAHIEAGAKYVVMSGDVVNTIITCEGGETILLTLDTTLPRSYSRAFTVRGTKGMYEMDTNSFFFDGMPEDFDTCAYYKRCIDNGKEYEERYMPDMWRNMTEEQKASGHGGMDYFIYREFVDCIKEGRTFPIDVYDAAAWMCITCLSEKSIANHGAPQEIPDFTNGAYKTRATLDVVKLEKSSV